MKLVARPKSSPLVSLTPLIDVVFILLIFFMLVSQFSRWQQQVLPLTSDSKSRQSDARHFYISMLPKAKFLLNERPISWQQLISKLLAQPNTMVTLAPSGDITLQQFIDVKDRLNNVGISNISSEFSSDEI